MSFSAEQRTERLNFLPTPHNMEALPFILLDFNIMWPKKRRKRHSDVAINQFYYTQGREEAEQRRGVSVIFCSRYQAGAGEQTERPRERVTNTQ